MNPKVSESIALLKKTPPSQIAVLDFVKDRFIQNYNATHRNKGGDLMYHRQMIFFNQLINSSQDLQNSDQFSLYACFVTAAVNGYSLDPADDEVYLIALGGKAFLWRQAGAHIKRLQRIGAIRYADQAQLVYDGDEFGVQMGRVTSHIEKFKSPNVIAGYIRFVLDDRGTDRFIVYRKSDFELWKAKSQSPNGANWNADKNGNPNAGFLRTKIVKHACKDKSWATGFMSPYIETFDGTEIDEPDEIKQEPETMVEAEITTTVIQPDEAKSNGGDSGAKRTKKPVPVDNDSF